MRFLIFEKRRKIRILELSPPEPKNTNHVSPMPAPIIRLHKICCFFVFIVRFVCVCASGSIYFIVYISISGYTTSTNVGL